jgi:uncharacterized membrane protein YraQ (UPF0718 family)
MIAAFWWGFVLRTAQAFVEASPTLLCGLLVAGIMRRMVGPAATRRLFGGLGWKGLIRAWGLGMVLPVCSLGVIPVARELRRAGVSGGTILAFVLVAPLLNPLSFLYGLTLAEPFIICCFVAGSLLLALTAGLLWERWFPAQADAAALARTADEPLPAPGPRRLLAVLVAAADELTGPTLGYVLLAVVATGLAAAALPAGMLQPTMRHDDPLSPLLMAAVATPVYMGPLPGMMRIGLMFEHGNSVGAAFVLFILGVSVNVGLMAWVVRSYGRKATLGWYGLVVGATLVLAYAGEYPLYRAAEEVGHTHAFDDFTSPFPSGASAGPAAVWGKLTQKLEILEPVALAGLALLALFSLAWRGLGRVLPLEAFLAHRPPPAVRPQPVWNRPVPGPVLGGVALVGLVLFSVRSAYLYYPPPAEVFAEMTRVRADAIVAVKTGHREEAIRRIQQWDLLTRKLQVGTYLRGSETSADAGPQAEAFRETLEQVRDALLAGQEDEARGLLAKLEEEYQTCRANYLGTARR